MRQPLEIKTERQIAAMRKACQLAGATRAYIAPFVQPGITTDALDVLIHDYIVKQNAYPSPLNYSGFPKSACASVNDVLCHGIPDLRPLEDGDIVSLDISCFVDGMHGDCCGTFLVGNVTPESTPAHRALCSSIDAAVLMRVYVCMYVCLYFSICMYA
jgi:methionyl aminopeptidase